jgi:fatty-acyl-CoA synthase
MLVRDYEDIQIREVAEAADLALGTVYRYFASKEHLNVFPREVEDVISTHPSVAAVAVVGVPDETWGEAVKAVVVPRSGQTVDVDELIALVKQQKGSHHAPKSVDIVDSIPVSAVGKPDKKALRARYWAGSDRLVH